MTKAVAEGLPKQRIEEAAAARAARVDTGETVIVGVNRYRLAEEEEHDFLEVDNAKVRAGQIARLEKMRAGAGRGEGARGAGCAGAGARNAEGTASGRGRPRQTLSLRAPQRRGVELAARRRAPASRSLGEISRRAGARVRPLRHHARAGARHLWQARATSAGRARSTGTAAVAATARPQAPHPGRQDGPGRPRPRRQSGLLGVRRPGLRGHRRAPVPDPARERPKWRSSKTSTWSAPRRSRRATRP